MPRGYWLLPETIDSSVELLFRYAPSFARISDHFRHALSGEPILLTAIRRIGTARRTSSQVRNAVRPRLWWSALLLAALGACSGTDAPLAEQPLSDGRTLKDLTVGATPTVVLLYDPADCFVCFAPLSEWVRWGRRHPDSFVLLFTREPSAQEQKQLKRYRLQPTAVLADAPHGLGTPREFLFVGGDSVFVDAVPASELNSQLLQYVMKHPVSELSEFPSRALRPR